MAVDELGDVPARGYDLRAPLTQVVEGTLHQLGAEPLAPPARVDLGVRHDDDPVPAAKGCVADDQAVLHELVAPPLLVPPHAGVGHDPDLPRDSAGRDPA